MFKKTDLVCLQTIILSRTLPDEFAKFHLKTYIVFRLTYNISIDVL